MQPPDPLHVPGLQRPEVPDAKRSGDDGGRGARHALAELEIVGSAFAEQPLVHLAPHELAQLLAGQPAAAKGEGLVRMHREVGNTHGQLVVILQRVNQTPGSMPYSCIIWNTRRRNSASPVSSA